MNSVALWNQIHLAVKENNLTSVIDLLDTHVNDSVLKYQMKNVFELLMTSTDSEEISENDVKLDDNITLDESHLPPTTENTVDNLAAAFCLKPKHSFSFENDLLPLIRDKFAGAPSNIRNELIVQDYIKHRFKEAYNKGWFCYPEFKLNSDAMIFSDLIVEQANS